MTTPLIGAVGERGLWVASGGQGRRLVVLLHGLGANANVWARCVTGLEARKDARWLALDFRGHGRSALVGPYAYGLHAADVAWLLKDERAEDVTLVGHSFGGVIAALLAGGLFGTVARDVVAVGVKLVWSAEEIAKAQALATRPPRPCATREEAIARALKLAGLDGLVAPESELAAAGIRETDVGCSVALDPHVFGAVGPSLPEIFRAVQTPLRLAAGAADPMVSLADMRVYDAGAVSIPSAGHNAHWEAPEAVLRLLDGSA